VSTIIWAETTVSEVPSSFGEMRMASLWVVMATTHPRAVRYGFSGSFSEAVQMPLATWLRIESDNVVSAIMKDTV
jgi:hypothetical protein